MRLPVNNGTGARAAFPPKLPPFLQPVPQPAGGAGRGPAGRELCRPRARRRVPNGEGGSARTRLGRVAGAAIHASSVPLLLIAAT
jgi:hypothetical protein